MSTSANLVEAPVAELPAVVIKGTRMRLTPAAHKARLASGRKGGLIGGAVTGSSKVRSAEHYELLAQRRREARAKLEAAAARVPALEAEVAALRAKLRERSK